MSWRKYQNLRIRPQSDEDIKNKYSVTSDILSFQLCRKQYGFFAVRKYQPAHVVQIWFGTIIHQVLDKLHMHYSGLLNSQNSGSIPSDNDVDIYFNQVEDSLKARGIRAINPDVRGTALKVLKIFNRIEGPNLYPKVIDTECSLQADQGDYVLHGKVDVLKDVSIGNRKIENYHPVEIWDYKGSKFPDINKQDGKEKLKRYTFQMLTYAELYKLKKGKYPLKGILYFMNELKTDPEPNVTPTQARYEIDLRSPLYINQITQAMNSFSQTVHEIEQCKQNNNWDSPQQMPDKETCDICDLRWNCTAVRGRYKMRWP